MSEPAPELFPHVPNWRKPLFLLVFVPCALVWLVLVAWVSWVAYHPVTDWVGRQHWLLQEILGPLLILGWALLLAAGWGGAAYLGAAAVGPTTPELPPPSPLPPGAKKWERGRNSTSRTN